MIRRISTLALLILLATNVYAGNDAPAEKVVTASAYYTRGKATIINHYLSDQQYKGPISGFGVEFGSMYKRSENLSWDLTGKYLGAGYSAGSHDSCIGNPAQTSFIEMQAYEVNYGTYYNWNPVKNLLFKAGGSVNVMGGLMTGVPDHVNNGMDFDLQTQLRAGVGVKYGCYFNKFGVSLQADFSVPFIGMAISSSIYESSADSIVGGEILPGTIQPFCFTSFHNFQSYDTKAELDFLFRKFTLFYAYERSMRSWYLNGLQNTRNYSLNRIGLKLDLVFRNRLDSSNRYF